MKDRNTKHNNKGFTLVEMIVVLAILVILLATSVMGLLAWQDWADFNRENEYAQSLFIAAQNQLSEYSAGGKLEELKEEFAVDNAASDENQYVKIGLNITDSVSLIKGEDGEYYNLDSIYSESEGKLDKKLYQGEIVAIRAKTGQYESYLEDPAKFKLENPEAYWVFELVGSYVYDTSILNGQNTDSETKGAAICIEFSPESGQVFSVLYSDKNDSFVYEAIENISASGRTADISDRTEDVRREKKIGYYGVDTLSKATKNDSVRPSVSEVKLYNRDTFYMTIKLSSKYAVALTQKVTYVMDLDNSKSASDKKLTVKLDGTKLKNKKNASAIMCPVIRYDESGNEEDLGELPIFAWIDPDLTVNVIYDAADIQASIFTYEQELPKLYGASDLYGEAKFRNTFSFFRFGVASGDVYASVHTTGGGYADSKIYSNFGHLNPFKNQDAKNTCFNAQNITDTEASYTIGNARHLYNVRYIEDISYEACNQYLYKSGSIETTTFKLSDDIDWATFQKNGGLYDSYDYSAMYNLSDDSFKNVLADIDGNPIEVVTRYNCGFPSLGAIREKDVFDGNSHKIDGITATEAINAIFGDYTVIDGAKTKVSEDKSTGFVNINYGTIKNLKLDKVYISGSAYVGGVTGINAGLVLDLCTANTNEKSLIIGRENVGGLIGFQMPTSEDLVIEKLQNAATVSGVKAVGGIVGMVRNEFSNINISKLDGLSAETKKLLSNPNDFKVTIKECANTGAVSGVNSSKLLGIYKGENGKSNKAAKDSPEEARYIGGIVGYMYNSYNEADKTDRIVILKCQSSPLYNNDKLIDILGDKDKLSEKLNGVYVGGIVGYNYFGEINGCYTSTAFRDRGYLFGYRYVGGIVGYNIGPASGIIGTNDNKQGINSNHVIAYEYAGGITGCNAGVKDKDSLDNDISKNGDLDPEKLLGLLVPDSQRSLYVKVSGWVNKGVVIAVNQYSGGITGYNSGYIYQCNSDVLPDEVELYFNALYSGNYAGGIAGYNNGFISNTQYAVSADGKNGTATDSGARLSTISYVKGHNYVGGVVGYNDVDSVVENYEIASGYVLGDTGSCFVGGYAGFNASTKLLMDKDGNPIEIISNPNNVSGDYFVGGCIGGNFINTADYVPPADGPVVPDEPDEPDNPTDDSCYATLVVVTPEPTDPSFVNPHWTNVNICITNNSGKRIESWSLSVDKNLYLAEGNHWNINIDKTSGSYDITPNGGEWNTKIPTGTQDKNVGGFNAVLYSQEQLDELNELAKIKFPLNCVFEGSTNSSLYGANEPFVNKLDVDFIWTNGETVWNDGDNKKGEYSLVLKNLTEESFDNWRVELPLTSECFSYQLFYGNSTIENDVLIFKPANQWHSIKPKANGENLTLGFQIVFKSEQDFANFLKTDIKIYNGDELIYKKTGDNPGDPVVPDEPDNPKLDKIITRYRTDNSLGQLNGKAFVGGYSGYNIVLDNANDGHENGYVYDLQLALISELSKKGSLKDKFDVVENIDNENNPSLASLSEQIKTSDIQMEIYGIADITTGNTNNLGSISGNICIGGVLGYGAAKTNLLIKNVLNASRITADTAIATDEQNGRTTAYNHKSMEGGYTYSYSGAIVGKVNEATVIDNCSNTLSATVQSKGTYTGALCEINDGKIINCKVVSFGASVNDYVGGICGLNNKGTISKCSFANATVSGRNVVGGIAAENFGVIKEIEFDKPSMLVAGISDGDRDGVTGLFAGYNGASGIITIENDIKDVNIVSGGRYVGAAVGYNEGVLYNAKVTNGFDTDNNLSVSGYIEGYQIVGGFIGCNNDPNPDRNVLYYTNRANVIANYGDAGGIIGINSSDNSIKYCVNLSYVAAVNSGNAGGITSVNYGNITKCYDYKTVNAPKGMSGGIVAVNGSETRSKEENIKAVISDCIVENKGAESVVTFASGESVGGIAAINSGIIKDNTMRNVVVKNFKDSTSTDMGIVVGSNLSMGEVILAPTQNIIGSRLLIESNNSNVGGIAGRNNGKIYGLSETMYEQALVNVNIALDYENTGYATYANIGGVAGINTGSIDNISVLGDINGKLGSSASGYGGIAGYSGYSSESAYIAAKEGDNPYVSTITNCSFDGNIHGTGSSGAPVRMGGITGINGYGSKISDCYIGILNQDANGNVTEASAKTSITAGDITKKGGYYNEVDNSSYSSIGGIAGENYGYILACDNEKYSTDRVDIIGFTGESAGIAGYNYVGGVVSGYVDDEGNEHWLTTGKEWYIDQRCAENDHGPGGIMGISFSAEDIRYVRNNAYIESTYRSNNKAGGIVGQLEQRYEPYVIFDHVENHGDIYGARTVGGFVGIYRESGARFTNCVNYGELKGGYEVGGFVGCHNLPTSGLYFTDCENHGNITLLEEFEHNNAKSVSGFVGSLINTNSSFVYSFYNCVNTGTITREASLNRGNNYGTFVGLNATNVYLENCRNYNTNSVNVNGFVGNGGSAYYKNCFDNSNVVTSNKNYSPFGGRGNSMTNLYYLSEDSERKVELTDYGVYFSMHMANGSNLGFGQSGNYKSYSDVKDPSCFMLPPSDLNTYYLKNSYAQINLGLCYGESETGGYSQGIDSLIIKLWNDSSSPDSEPLSYTATAYFTYSDGTVLKVTGLTGTGAYNLENSTDMVIKNPSATDAYPVNIRINFDQKNLFYKGFTYIAKEASDRELAVLPSSRQFETGFSFNCERVYPDTCVNYEVINEGVEYREYTGPSYNQIQNENVIANEYKFSNVAKYTDDYLDYNYYIFTKDDGQEYCYDYITISRDAKKFPDVNKLWYDLTFDVTNGLNSPGMDKFVFYLSDENRNSTAAEKDIKHIYYDYYLTFTDCYGNTVITQEYKDVPGSNIRSLSRQEISVPDGLDKRLSKVVLHIRQSKAVKNNKEQSNNGSVYLQGFSWIPVGETDEYKLSAGAHINAKTLYNNKLYVDYDSKYSTNNEPYVYPLYNYDYGFLMNSKDNDPISDEYYGDLTKYGESKTEGEVSGSRIDVYKDMDPKVCSMFDMLYLKRNKLKAPENLQVSTDNSQYILTWDEVKDAYAYEVRYRIVDENGNDILTDIYSEPVMVQTNNRVYAIDADNSWVDNKYAILFEVRSINGYHDYCLRNQGDVPYDAYDSDWSGSEKVTTKRELPEPSFYMEIVDGNKTVIVIDNYEEYVEEGCSDFTFNLKFAGVNYSINVGETGKYSEPMYITFNSNGNVEYIYKAVPNASIEDYYVASAEHKELTRAHNNGSLPNCARLCSVDFRGFFGTAPMSMTYDVLFTVGGVDSYQITDISAYDDNIGATVAYCTDITHTANSEGKTNVKMTSTMKNLPLEWFGEDNIDEVTVRAYLYSSQYNVVRYGHEVTDGIVLDGTVDENRAKLAGIIDSGYFAADATYVCDNPIWDASTNDLKEGYVLQKQEDGTYSVYYSAVLAMSMKEAANRRAANSEPYRRYYNYSVDYAIYKKMSDETGGVTEVNSADFQESYWIRKSGNHSNTTTNDSRYYVVQEYQPEPVIDGQIEVGYDAEGKHKVYSLAWDRYYLDVNCFNYNANNNTPRYTDTRNNKLTNAPAGMFETWDLYCEKAARANLSNVTGYASLNGNQKRSLMNAYYMSYSKAKYTVQLIGTTIDGETVILDTKEITSPNSLGTITEYTDDNTTKKLYAYDGVTETSYELYNYGCEFTDVNDVWANYPLITARIIRNGEMSSVIIDGLNNSKPYTSPNGATYILPRYKDYSLSQLLGLGTIAKPGVSLTMVDGKYNTNELLYNVEWGAVTNSYQLKDLGGYLITVSVETPADENKRAKTHYYYVEEIANTEVTDTIGLDISSLNGEVIRISEEEYVKGNNTRSVVIDLSDFNSNDIVNISVKAIARSNSTFYTDGNEGEKNIITILARLLVPDIALLSAKVSALDGDIPDMVSMDEYKSGISFTYQSNDSRYENEPTTKLLLAAAVYDELPAGEDLDMSKHNGLDAPSGEADTAYWNAGAVRTIYTKGNPLELGYVSGQTATTIDITAFERYPGELAGKWIKVCIKARCTSKIDSQWTDQDAANETLNYKWIHIPGIRLDDVELNEMDYKDEEGIEYRDGVVRYFYDGAIYDSVPEDEGKEYASLTQKTLTFSEDRILTGYQLGVILKAADGEAVSPSYKLYIQKHYDTVDNRVVYDGSWDVFVAGGSLTADLTNTEVLANNIRFDAESKGYEIPVCVFDDTALFVGNIGDVYDDLQDRDALPYHIESGIISLEDICGTYLSYRCIMQLRYSEGKFYMVLPDLIDVDGVGSNNNPSYYITESVMVSPFLYLTVTDEGTLPYQNGKGSIFKRVNDPLGNTTEITVCDAITVKDWLLEYGISLN